MNLEVMQLYISQWFTDSTLGSMLIKVCFVFLLFMPIISMLLMSTQLY